MPFFLIAWGQQYIDSGLAAIFNASAPLFTALFALSIDRSQRVTGSRLAGVVLGSAASSCSSASSSAAASAPSPERSRSSPRRPATASAASTRAGASPACRPSLVAFGSLAWATLFVLPVGAAQASSFGWEALLSVLYLGVAATGVAYLLYFGLIAGAGASKAVLVTYLVPVARARLRRRLPRRGRDGGLARRPCARARRRRARHRHGSEEPRSAPHAPR